MKAEGARVRPRSGRQPSTLEPGRYHCKSDWCMMFGRNRKSLPVCSKLRILTPIPASLHRSHQQSASHRQICYSNALLETLHSSVCSPLPRFGVIDHNCSTVQKGIGSGRTSSDDTQDAYACVAQLRSSVELGITNSVKAPRWTSVYLRLICEGISGCLNEPKEVSRLEKVSFETVQWQTAK